MTTAAAPRASLTEGRPRAWRLLLDQAEYAVRDLWRTRVVLIFTFVLPLVLLVMVGLVAGDATVDATSGVRVVQFMTPSAAAMGILFATLPTIAISLSDARERGVVKRVQGTPLPGWIYLTGRIAGAVVFALASFTAALAVGVLAFDVQIIGRTAVATAVTVIVGIAAFTALGMAVAALSSSATVAEAASVAGSVILMFISGLFAFGGEMPSWLSTAASALPLKPFAEALQDQFNPFHTGAGWDLGALGIVAAWGVASTAVTAWALRRGRSGERGGRAPVAPRTSAGPESRSSSLTTPRAPALVLDQAGAAIRSEWRDPGSVFFAVIMPVGLYAFIITLQGSDVGSIDGAPFATFFAASMVAWGVAVASFQNLAEKVARARDRGVLKRLRGTPLRPWQYLAGRAVAAVGIGVLIAGLVLVLGVAFYGLELTPAGLGLGVVAIVAGTLTFIACGFALAAVVRTAKAVSAVGLVILLPLAFFSDVFVIGGPDWMGTVGSVFPLKHVQNALALAWDPAEPTLALGSLGVLALWGVAASVVALRYFRWDVESARP